MRSLMEMSARKVLTSGLNEDDYYNFVEYGCCGDPEYLGPATRCDCDLFSQYFKTDHTTTQYIDVLPLPTAVKDYMKALAKKLCEDHDEFMPSSDDEFVNTSSEFEDSGEESALIWGGPLHSSTTEDVEENEEVMNSSK